MTTYNHLISTSKFNRVTGGEISVYSAGPGQGSTFAFYITAYTAESAEEGRESLTRILSNMQLEDPDEQKPVYTVLIVEDNVVNQKVLSKQLQKNGYIVHVANHGKEALEFLQTTRHYRGNEEGIDLTVVLMDVVSKYYYCNLNISRNHC